MGGGGVQPSTLATFRTVLVWVMGLLVVACAVILVLRDDGSSLVLVSSLGLLAVWVSTAVCWLAVSRVGFWRWEVLLAAVAMTSYVAGNTYYIYIGALAGATSLPFPTVGDVGYLSFYPFMLAALVLAVRRHLPALAWLVWLDSAVGSLGAAAVLAVLLSPVLNSVAAAPLSLATVVTVAYPMFDLVLVAAVAGIVAGGIRMGSRWRLLVLGLLV